MKIVAAFAVQIAILAAFSAGIILFAMKGNPWLLVVSSAAFLAGFIKFGCLDHH